MTHPIDPAPRHLMRADAIAEGAVLLYDGECGVCSASVQWILDHERQHTLRFVALQSQLGSALRQAAGISGEIDSLIWLEVTEQQVRGFVWSDALLCVLNYVGGPFRMLSAVRFVPRPLRDAAYRLFARHRLAFAPASCALPSPQFRERFLSSP